MNKRLYCVWRVDGEFNITDLSSDFQDKDKNTILIEAIKKEAENISFENEQDKQKYVENTIAISTDPDCPWFIGYEMPVVFVTDESVLEFIGD